MSTELQKFKSEFFKALAHPLRVKILESLREGDKSVNELNNLLEIENSAVSQQLSILRAKNIVVGKKEGNKVTYTVKDPLIFELLDVAKAIFNNHLIEAIDLLKQIENE
ncbi:MAG TPA: metalloregulator ArsR/SmtB family transcription factor [Desulfobacteria bacterium]|nr:metalloregulator ArsR/SmtB family transcription factor [Desulfobacteria bacterium]